MMNQGKGINMLTNDQIKEIALQNGFKLKEQPGGEMDLNPYVYHFAKTLESGVQAITAQKYTEAFDGRMLSYKRENNKKPPKKPMVIKMSVYRLLAESGVSLPLVSMILFNDQYALRSALEGDLGEWSLEEQSRLASRVRIVIDWVRRIQCDMGVYSSKKYEGGY